jgi:uncharacterized protein YceH (UPF0502 family)
MDAPLDPLEIRVLGCLIEKELATPEYCPLTLNALVNACNQKSNRDPVMLLGDDDVERSLRSLAHQQLAIVSGEGGRATKYRHFLEEKWGLNPAQLALLAELMLRGPQTPGELRARVSRMVEVPDVTTVIGVYLSLEDRDPPLATTLPRQPGRKEARYAHLLAGAPAAEAASDDPPAESSSVLPSPGRSDRVAALEDEVAGLQSELAALQARVDELERVVLGRF